MLENTMNINYFTDIPDLEKKILIVSSIFEISCKSENLDEYVFLDGRRVRPKIEGRKSFLKAGPITEMETPSRITHFV